MSIESDFYDYLVGTAEIASLVGTRVYEDMMPQRAEYPAIVYTVVGENRPTDYTLQGVGGNVETQMLVTCYATSGVSRRALSQAVRDALNGYTGEWGSREIQAVFMDEGGQANVEPSPENAQTRIYSMRNDLTIHHVDVQGETDLTNNQLRALMHEIPEL